MYVWVKFYGGSKLRLTTVRHVTSIGPSMTPVSTQPIHGSGTPLMELPIHEQVANLGLHPWIR